MIKTNFIRSVNFLFALGIMLNTWAQSGNSNFVTYDVENGIIQSHVATLVQDFDGNLWIGTIGGLTKYNGTEFTSYTTKQGLSEDWISASCLDSKGNIWLGHWGGGVTLISSKGKKIQDLVLEKLSSFSQINGIAEGPGGKIWFATEKNGVFYFDPEKKESNNIYSEEFSSPKVKSLYVDNNKNIWACTDKGITVFNPANNKVVGILNSENGLKSDLINTVCKVAEKEVWVATGDNGVIRILDDGKYDEVGNSKLLTKDNGLTSNSINVLFKDDQGIVWIGTADKGTNQYVTGKQQGDFISGSVSQFSNEYEMNYFIPNCIIQDREKNIWIGTGIGLNLYLGELFRIFNHNDKLSNDLVWSVEKDKNGSIWAGTNSGVNKFTFKQENGVRNYTSPDVKSYNSRDGLAGQIINVQHQDDKGNMWFGSENEGVSVLNTNGSWKKYGTSSGLPGNNVFTITSGKKGHIWVGTNNGAAKINPETGEVSSINMESGLGGDKVFYIFKDSKDNLWFCILGGQLTKYDGSNYKTFGNAEGLNNVFVMSATEDSKGTLWFGAYDGGIYKYDGTSFTNYNTKKGMSSNSPNFIICDKNDKLWIGVNTGIERFDPETETFSLYGKQEGFLGIETNQNSVCSDDDGNIWFGTIRGMVKFDQSKERPNLVAPLLSIEKVELFSEAISVPTGSSFSYDQNHFTFGFKAVSLTNPEHVTYQFMIDGIDKDWNPPTKQNKIVYPGLAAGTYKFKVIAANNDGIKTEVPAEYEFTITPPLWKRGWFQAMVLILAIVGVVAFVKNREKQLKERQKELEHQVDVRTKELREEKEKVEEQKEEINKKNLNITESINYAQRIQNAVLPPDSEIERMLPNSYIFYQPKDIVSGDFYWVHETKSGKVLFTAVDCTGHGVPGAFMSIIGVNLLEQIVIEQGIETPSKILDKLSLEIARTLRQESGEDSVKDGMDLALCCLDRKNNKVEFAGAYNPLYHIKNKSVIEVKGDKIPIGKTTSLRKESNFTNHEIDVEEGDMLVVFSDGYADQKGGPKSKKFFYRPFREMLEELSTKPLNEQHDQIKKAINDWKGENEQYDDMLVFGVKV